MRGQLPTADGERAHETRGQTGALLVELCVASSNRRRASRKSGAFTYRTSRYFSLRTWGTWRFFLLAGTPTKESVLRVKSMKTNRYLGTYPYKIRLKRDVSTRLSAELSWLERQTTDFDCCCPRRFESPLKRGEEGALSEKMS